MGSINKLEGIGKFQGGFGIMYPMQKGNAIAKRLKEVNNYTSEDISNLLKQYGVDKNPDALEELEHDILKAEDPLSFVEETKEDNPIYAKMMKELLVDDYHFDEKEIESIIRQCVGSLYTAKNIIENYSKLNKMEQNLIKKQQGLLELLNIKKTFN